MSNLKKSPEIKYLFEPRTIAVIGASHSNDKIGFKICENIVTGGYKGELYPINPKGGEVLGKKMFTKVEDVPAEIDLAVVCIPAKMVYDSVVECAKKKVKFLSIITSGFSEVGNHELEKQIVDYAREHGMRILGPNIFGTFSAKSHLNATFGPRDICYGNVAIITQSGALGIAMIGKTAVEKIGLSSIISVGNKSDIGEADLLEYLVDDKDTKVILMYIEGVQNGEAFVAALKKATRRKPIIVIKSGRSKRGAMAAASHTGSLAGADEVFDDIMRQCGVLRAESLQEAFAWARFVANNPLPKGDHSVIVTNGGGVGVMATDASEKYGVKMFDDAEELKRIYGPVTPDFGSTKNPIDLTGQASSANYQLALNASLENPKIDSVIGLYCETALFDVENLPKVIKAATAKSVEVGKPIVFSLLGGERVERCIGELRSDNVPVFADVYEAVSCLGSIYRCYNHEKREEEAFADPKVDIEKIERIVEGARKDGRSFLLAHEGQALIQAAGISIPQSRLAKSADEAVKLAEEIGYPVVMKVVSRDILHKSDSGGVVLNLTGKEKVAEAYASIMTNCLKHVPNANIEGIEVCEMVKRGVELIVGARIDNSFGPTVMCGLGGVYVEVMKDVSFRSAWLGKREAEDMIKDIKSYPLLLGVRGEKRKDISGVVDGILKLAKIIRTCRGITDIEVNPLVAYDEGSGVKAVDVRVLISK